MPERRPTQGPTVADLLDVLDLSLEEIATRSGISRKALSSIRDGRAQPRRQTTLRMAKVLGVTVEQFRDAVDATARWRTAQVKPAPPAGSPGS